MYIILDYTPRVWLIPPQEPLRALTAITVRTRDAPYSKRTVSCDPSSKHRSEPKNVII